MELGRSNDVSAWRSQRVFQRSVYTYLKLLLSSLPVAVPVNGAHTVLFSSVPRCGLSSFFFFLILFIYFWLRWVFITVHGLSLVAASRGYSSLWCAGFSLQWLLFVAEHGL